jgi:hypothetical protein
MYRLDDIPLRSIGVIPCLNKERIALEGVFNLPKRKGTSEYSWGTEIEPFVDAEDMEFDGRSLTLNAWIRGNTPEEYAGILNAFKASCIQCRVLSTGYDDFAVLLKDEVKVTEYIGHNRARAAATFWQEAVTFPELSTAATGGPGYLLDGYNLLDFGIRVSERRDNSNVGKRIEVGTTLPYSRTEYRDKATAVLRCYMRGNDFAGMYWQMTQFHALCAAPGLRVLRYPDGSQVTGYFKDGFTVKAVHHTKLDFDLKMRVV